LGGGEQVPGPALVCQCLLAGLGSVGRPSAGEGAEPLLLLRCWLAGWLAGLLAGWLAGWPGGCLE
jgi:hypothetical protein